MPVYIDRLHLMKEEGRTTLLVDFEHLNDYDGELAEVRCPSAYCWQVAACDCGRQRCSASLQCISTGGCSSARLHRQHCRAHVHPDNVLAAVTCQYR